MVTIAAFTAAGIFAGGRALCVDGLGALRRPLVLGFGIGIPLFCGAMLWAVLAIRKQQQEPSSDSSSYDSFPDLEKAIQPSDMVDDDETEMDDIIDSIWLAPPCLP
ncbi:hypothetical protein CHU98_g7069 [Xylaria longipes]|nr:hypothetical protein CHU98_g7069 [Xylaria longipes]